MSNEYLLYFDGVTEPALWNSPLRPHTNTHSGAWQGEWGPPPLMDLLTPPAGPAGQIIA